MNRLSLIRTTSFLALALLGAVAPAQEVPKPVADALARANQEIEAILKVPRGQRTFSNTVLALDDLSFRLERATNIALFMQFVSTDQAERDAARAGTEAVSNWETELGKREDLYNAIKEYAATNPRLEGEDKRMLDHLIRDYRRAGMDLPTAKRDELKAIELELTKLEIEFESNIADDESKVSFTKEELKGLPEGVLGRLPQSSGLYMLGMDGPTYGAVVEYCENPLTRQKMWLAHKRRAGMKNVRLLERIIKLRAQAAALLGYKNRVDYEIETRMAKDSATVAKFYQDLMLIVRKKALQDMAELNDLKRKHTGDPAVNMRPWDYAFYQGLLKKEKYAVDSEKVAEYFPMESVVEGLFTITSSLFNISYKDATSRATELGMPLWHADVKLYEVLDKPTGETLGWLYTDLYPRDNKYTHAACWGLWPRKVWADGKVDKPMAALVCNFTKPTADKPSLLRHDEVETFFHEFGHGLHQVLTNTKHARFSGTRMARDFVEAPSQMLENWVWNRESLRTFAKHYKTGEPLPDTLLEGMLKARNVGSGIDTEFQFFLGRMDQRFHTEATGNVDTVKEMHAAFAETMLYEPVQQNLYHASFGHMTGYQGAYYGYMWSNVFAQDMFQRFGEKGILSPEAGMYYRSKILGRGGSMDEMDMLRDYLGREPKMDAFLKHLGLAGG